MFIYAENENDHVKGSSGIFIETEMQFSLINIVLICLGGQHFLNCHDNNEVKLKERE